MPSRIVLFGATGFTGELTARAMVARGLEPVLAARSRARVETLAKELGGLEARVADVAAPASLDTLLHEGDVLVTTVGPFMRWGSPALDAAIRRRAHYLDSTGEGPFIRDVFEKASRRAEPLGIALLPAMGYDFVPGNLAGALALEKAGPNARRIEIGYCWEGAGGAGGMSGGTRASAAGVLFDSSFAWKDGRIRTERGAKSVRSFDVDGREIQGISIGGTEHFALPRLDPQLEEVGVYLGWFGPMTRPLQVIAAGNAAITKVPGVRQALTAAMGKVVKGSTGGPDDEARARTRSVIVATAYDANGVRLASVQLSGPNGYDLTAAFLAWGAERAANGEIHGRGAMGPVEAFGLEELRAGAAEYGLIES
jgi:short subunit dehydrogenase-like uncharacterized protein